MTFGFGVARNSSMASTVTVHQELTRKLDEFALNPHAIDARVARDLKLHSKRTPREASSEGKHHRFFIGFVFSSDIFSMVPGALIPNMLEAQPTTQRSIEPMRHCLLIR